MWVIRAVQHILTPLLPPQDPQSLAEEEVWREVRLPDHLPQHGEEQRVPQSVGVCWISGLVLLKLDANLPGLNFTMSRDWTY